MRPPALPQQTNSATHQCAIFSVIAPLIAFLLAGALNAWLELIPRAAMMVADVFFFLVVIAGLITAIVGLCGIQKYGTRKLLGRSIAGLIINGLLLGLFAVMVIAGLKKAVAGYKDLVQMQNDTREIQAKARESFNDDTGITNFDINSMNKVQGDLDRAAKTLTGDGALMSQVLSQYLSRMRASHESYEIEATKLRAANILAFSNVTSRADLATSRRLVEHFMRANLDFDMTISNSETSIRADLEKMNLPPEKVEGLVNNIPAEFTLRCDLNMRIGECNNDLGQAMLAILDQLDFIWGKWHFDPVNQKVFFKHDVDLEIYNNELENIHSAEHRRVVFQKQFLNLH